MNRMLMFLAIAAMTASTVRAEDDTSKCDLRTLQGDYGFHVEGVILSIPGVPVPPGGFHLRGVAMTHFDGKGKLTQVDFITVNGTPPPADWTPATGTYTVNGNCTGTWQLNIPGNPLSPVNVHFVIVKRGSEIRTVVDANAVTSLGIKVD